MLNDGQHKKISLNELSKDDENGLNDIINVFEDNKLSDSVKAESDLSNIKPLALDIKEKMANNGVSETLKIGFSNIDDDINFLSSGLIIFEGPKASGKTCFTIQSMIQILQENPKIPVFYFAYGDSKKDIQIRTMLSLTNIKRSDYRKGQFEDNEIAKGLKEYQRLGDRFFIIQGNQNYYPNKIKDTIINTLNKYYENNIPQENSCVVILDYLQEIPSIVGQNMEERIFNVINALKDISKMLSIPLIVVYGNNDVEKLITENDEIKVTVEKKETLDFAADVYISLVPSHMRGTDKLTKNLPKDVRAYTFKISKNKNGDIGEKNLLYSPSYAKWYSVNL